MPNAEDAVLSPLGPNDPQEIAGYRLLARIGEGGMGSVYLSRTRGNQPVALKVIRREFAQESDFRARFEHEVQAARRVQGYHIVPVLDHDTSGEQPWLATAFVPGLALDTALAAHGPLPLPAVFQLIGCTAQALHSVHAASVIHRDLKPSNILLGQNGPFVIDFGIARATDTTQLTRSGGFIGTPQYMSPEHALGRQVTAATDIFALGLIAAVTATGRHPYGDGGGISIAASIANTPQQAPDLSGYPDELRPLLERCLAADPAARPGPAELAEWCQRSAGRQLRDFNDWLPAPLAQAIARREQLAQTPPPPAHSPDRASAAPAPPAYAPAQTPQPQAPPAYAPTQAPQPQAPPAYAPTQAPQAQPAPAYVPTQAAPAPAPSPYAATQAPTGTAHPAYAPTQGPGSGPYPGAMPYAAPTVSAAPAPAAPAGGGGRSKVPLIVGAGVLVLALAAGGTWYVTRGDDEGGKRTEATGTGGKAAEPAKNTPSGTPTASGGAKPSGSSASASPAAPAYTVVFKNKSLKLLAPRSFGDYNDVDLDFPKVAPYMQGIKSGDREMQMAYDGVKSDTPFGKSKGSTPEECETGAATNPIPNKLGEADVTGAGPQIAKDDLLCTVTSEGNLAMVKIVSVEQSTDTRYTVPTYHTEVTLWTRKK
ncbi:serine/threonine-protein kinase [Streptomyces sp. NPDC048603]|uniref:serine/threonine-protein kinase n=1 Tax=Streptomyces sp. NPDC048603 TaxID=3365577 RepID=UPI003714B74D